MLVWEC